MPKTQAVAQALAGSYPVMNEPGLEVPPEMKLLQALNAAGSGFGLGQLGAGVIKALTQKGVPALQGLGEAGAIFPEGELPPGFTKGEMFTPSERAYKVNELNEQLYLHNNDFQNALKAKWAMLKNSGGN